MPMALPFVGAAAGWLVGGTAVWAQVGWMVGAAIYSAVQPAPTISAGNPSTAPSVGSDIRGQNIPVVFGTVRCSGYLIWQKNFKSTKNTRKVGSGKKKTKQEYYTYSWDFLFHLGMVTRPYKIIGIWEGSERLQDDSLAAITFANGNNFAPAAKVEQTTNLLRGVGSRRFWGLAVGSARFRQLQSTQAAKTFTAAESYWYGGHDSDSAENGWAYFQAQESAPDVRWPSSMWIGFKQLQLGEQPRIPQYNFEVTPDIDPTVNAFWDDTLNSGEQLGNLGDYPIGVTAGGRYALFSNVFNTTMVRIVETASGRIVDSVIESELDALFPEVSNYVEDSEFCGAVCIPGTSDFIMTFSGTQPPGPNQNNTLVLFLNVDDQTGAISRVGYSYWEHNLPVRIVATEGFTNVTLDRDQNYLYGIAQIISSGQMYGYKIPYPRTLGDGLEGTQSQLSALDIRLMDTAETEQFQQANTGFGGFAVPMANGNVRFYYYISQARVEHSPQANDIVAANAGTYPNGFMFYVELDSSLAIVSGPTICHSDFNTAGPPFDNEGLNEDGSPADLFSVGYSERFFVGPCSLSEEDSNWIVAFERMLDDENNNDSGGMHSFRVFEFNTTTGEFTLLNEEFVQQMEDNCLKYNLTPPNRFSSLQRSGAMVAYAPISGELYRLGFIGSTSRAYLLTAKVGKVRCGIIDYTPPEIIREIFTDPVIGFGKSVNDIDTDSYNDAVKYCLDNGILVSVVFAASADRISIFESLVNVYGGWVSWTGTKLKFGKPTEVFSAVGVIDNDCYVQENPDDPKPPLQGKRQALQDTTNKVTVKYYDRSLSYRQNEVTLADEVDMDLNGPRHKQLNTGMVMAKETAYRLAERTLWGNLYARNIYPDVLVGWKCAHYEPGDGITLIDSLTNTHVNARIVKREELARNKIRLTLIEELDYLGKSKAFFELPKPSVRGLPTTTDLPLDFNAYELPYEFQRSGPRYYVGWAPGAPSASAGLYTSPSTTDFRLQQSVVPYPDSGRIITHLPATEDIAQNVRVIVNAKSGANVNSIDPWFEGELQDFNSFDRAQGLSTVWIGSEMVAYEGATLVSCNVYVLDRVYRGWGGTYIHAHSPGDVFWQHDPNDGGGIFAVPYAADQIGTKFYYKVVPVGFDGVEMDPTSVSYKEYTLGGTHFAPRGLSNDDLRVLVGSDTVAPASLANQYGPQPGSSLDYINPFYARRVGASGHRNIMVTWPEVSQTTGFGAQGFGTVPYGNFQADLDPVSWLVNVVGSGGVVVRSTLVSSPYFRYDEAANAADNGAWRGNVAVSVLPRNVYGNAPFAGIVSLQLDGS